MALEQKGGIDLTLVAVPLELSAPRIYTDDDDDDNNDTKEGNDVVVYIVYVGGGKVPAGAVGRTPSTGNDDFLHEGFDSMGSR